VLVFAFKSGRQINIHTYNIIDFICAWILTSGSTEQAKKDNLVLIKHLIFRYNKCLTYIENNKSSDDDAQYRM